LAIDEFVGATAIDTSVAAITVSVCGELIIAPDAAVMLVDPTPTPDANPEPLIVAVPVEEEFQVAVPLKFAVLKSV
jgi:hypothetical protein